jgi:hypothetical protein
MGRSALRLAVVVLSFAASTSSAEPAGKHKVAVVPGIAVNLDAARVDALGQDLAEALASQLDVDAIGGLDVRRELPSEGLPADCVSTPSCTADVARRTGATQLLFAVMVGGAGGSVEIDTTWVEPASGHSAARPAVDLMSSSDADAKAKFESVARQLLPDAPVREKPQAVGHVTIDTKMSAGTPRHLTTPAWIAGGVAVAGLASGITFGLVTRSKYNSCADALACSTSQKGTIRAYAAVADTSFGIAIVGAAITTVLWATSGEEPHVIVAPTPEGATAAWIGSF